MKKIKLNGNTYECPTSWDSITLKQQIKVSADSSEIKIEKLKKFAVLSGYAGIPIDVLKTAKLSDLSELFKAIDFINEPIPSKPITEFDFKANHYYCGQNLIDMQFQDFISIENILQEYSGNTYTALPTILAIMCKRKKDGILETIDDYDIPKRAEIFLDLPITIAYQLQVFFSASENLFGKTIPLSLKIETQEAIAKKQIEEIKSMLQVLDGKAWLTRCASGVLRYCLRYTKRHVDKHCTSTA